MNTGCSGCRTIIIEIRNRERELAIKERFAKEYETELAALKTLLGECWNIVAEVADEFSLSGLRIKAQALLPQIEAALKEKT
jgi:hypothetical protein